MNKLTPEEARVILYKGTEAPFTGEYDNFPDAVNQIPDPDGSRTEIVCANCDGHLGHVFTGEQMTDKNTRHCVNSLSIKFIPKGDKLPEVLKK